MTKVRGRVINYEVEINEICKSVHYAVKAVNFPVSKNQRVEMPFSSLL